MESGSGEILDHSAALTWWGMRDIANGGIWKFEELGMKVAWYEKQGPAEDVLMVGEMNEPLPLAGEVRIRVAFSGVNPGDVKKREDAFGVGMPYPRVISHSDGSGTVDRVGEGVSEEWICRRVWCYGAQSYRPFGTAAEYTVVPLRHVAEVPRGAARAGGLPRHSWHHCAWGR